MSEREFELQTSTKVSYYRRRKPLGHGGVGIVHEAQQLALGRDVAIKAAHADLPPDEARQLLLREARVTSVLEHPSIVPIYALAHNGNGRPIIIMRRIQGETWGARLLRTSAMRSEERLSEHLELLEQVARIVHFAHGRGIIHRDLKPENVMVSDDDQVFVLDWGMAITMGDERIPEIPHAADVTSIDGSPAYMAPELAAGVGTSMDARTDVYLLGAILHELLTGEAPHEAENVLEAVLLATRSAKPSFDDTIPVALATVCTRAMSRFNDDRFANAAKFADAIAEFRVQHESERLVLASAADLEKLQRLSGEVELEDENSRARFEEQFRRYRAEMDRALVLWPDNPKAQEALQQAFEINIALALRADAPQVAEALLAQMPLENESLRVQVGDAVRSRLLRDRRHRELEQSVDPQLGLGVRIGATIGFGVFWVSICALCMLFDREGHREAVYFVFATLLGVGSMAMNFLPRVAGLADLGKGQNRRALGMFRASWLGMASAWILCFGLGLPLPAAAAVHTLVGLTVVLAIVSSVDHRWWPLAVTEGAQLVLLLIWPEFMLFIMAVIGVLDGVGASAAMKWTAPSHGAERSHVDTQ